jgi:carboxypeptidase Q
MLVKLIVLVLVFTTLNAEKDYTDFVKFLKTQIENKNGPFYHSAYNRLAYISDTYGPRMWGSQVLEMVISEVFTMAAKEGF